MATGELGLGAIMIVIIRHRPVAHHCANVRMLVIVLAVVIAISIEEDTQTSEKTLCTKGLP